MKCMLLIGCLLFIGCEKNHDPSRSFISMRRDAHIAGSINVVAMGQSNMENMTPAGLQAFVSAMPPYQANVANCSVGGTPITYWLPSTPAFENCMRKFQRIDAILYAQGETDTAQHGDGLGDIENAPEWARLFTSIVREIQKRNPGCKIVFAELGQDTGQGRFSGWQTVKAQQDSIHLNNVMMMKTDDQPNSPVGDLHYSVASYQIFGTRYAQALKQLLAGQ